MNASLAFTYEGNQRSDLRSEFALSLHEGQGLPDIHVGALEQQTICRAKILDHLPPREADFVELYFFRHLKQTDIASHHNYTSQDWRAAAYFLRKFTRLVLSRKLPADVDLLKIDVPDGADEDTGWQMTRLSRSSYYTKHLDNTSIDTRVCDFKTRIRVAEEEVESDSDIYALAVDKQVAVTPLSLDFTSRVDLGSLRDSFLS